jgi:tRNA-Thr(GGU) m(6)t(6)A37 methyltransferase TsaA
MDITVSYTAIGVVKSEYDQPSNPVLRAGVEAQVVIDEALQEGLTGLEPGQSILVIFHFHHKRKPYELLQHPRGDPSLPQRGVFALRSPRRPNLIGVTTVELLAIEGNVLYVRGLDALNGTPVLDIKPA